MLGFSFMIGILKPPESLKKENNLSITNLYSIHENTIYIIIIFTFTFGLIARDWRKRKWIQ